jgi:hypothetical protein
MQQGFRTWIQRQPDTWCQSCCPSSLIDALLGGCSSIGAHCVCYLLKVYALATKLPDWIGRTQSQKLRSYRGNIPVLRPIPWPSFILLSRENKLTKSSTTWSLLGCAFHRSRIPGILRDCRSTTSAHTPAVRGRTSGGGTRWWETHCATPHPGSTLPLSALESTSSSRPPTTALSAPPATTTTKSPPRIHDSKVRPHSCLSPCLLSELSLFGQAGARRRDGRWSSLSRAVLRPQEASGRLFGLKHTVGAAFSEVCEPTCQKLGLPSNTRRPCTYIFILIL